MANTLSFLIVGAAVLWLLQAYPRPDVGPRSSLDLEGRPRMRAVLVERTTFERRADGTIVQKVASEIAFGDPGDPSLETSELRIALGESSAFADFRTAETLLVAPAPAGAEQDLGEKTLSGVRCRGVRRRSPAEDGGEPSYSVEEWRSRRSGRVVRRTRSRLGGDWTEVTSFHLLPRRTTAALLAALSSHGRPSDPLEDDFEDLLAEQRETAVY